MGTKREIVAEFREMLRGLQNLGITLGRGSTQTQDRGSDRPAGLGEDMIALDEDFEVKLTLKSDRPLRAELNQSAR